MPAGDGQAPAQLRLATLNVFFDERARTYRARQLLRAIAEWDADIVALQEGTPEVLELLMSDALIRQRYALGIGSMRAGYGVVIASRIPLSALLELELPSMMGRTALVATLPGDSGVAIATVHLESTRPMWRRRNEQLALLGASLDAHPTALIAGDLNFAPSDPEEAERDQRFRDLWPELHPAEPGFTEDTDRNFLRLLTEDGAHKQARYDRILVRGTALRAKSIELVGTDPFPTPAGPMWLSDHFGVLVDLEHLVSSVS